MTTTDPLPHLMSGWSQLRLLPPACSTLEVKLTTYADPKTAWHLGLSLTADDVDTVAIESLWLPSVRSREVQLTSHLRRWLQSQSEVYEPF